MKRPRERAKYGGQAERRAFVQKCKDFDKVWPKQSAVRQARWLRRWPHVQALKDRLHHRYGTSRGAARMLREAEWQAKARVLSARVEAYNEAPLAPPSAATRPRK